MSAQLIALVVSALTGLVTLKNWRYGLLCIIGIGVLQDVLRKLTPGVPAYYIVWSMAMFGLVMLVALFRKQLGSVRRLWLGDLLLESAVLFYLLVVIVYALYALVRWGSPVIPLFGLVFYLGPVAALLLVASFAQRGQWMGRFLGTYLVVMVPVCLSIYLSPGFETSIPALRDVGSFTGEQLVIYDLGTMFYSYSGLLRVGEIAAFHAATCIAILSMLLYRRNTPLSRKALYALLIVGLLGAIALTGRRKMLLALALFWALQFLLFHVLSRGISRRVLLSVIVGVALGVGLVLLAGNDTSALYIERGTTVIGGLGERVNTALVLFDSAMDRSSWIGLGAGTASQGMRYAGIDMGLYVGGSSESGLGYIAVELGIPGMLAVLWLLFNMTRVLWARLRQLSALDDEFFQQAVTYTAFLAANLATFATATQLYGDYFVLITLGVFAGGLYAAILNGLQKRRVLKYLLIRESDKLVSVP